MKSRTWFYIILVIGFSTSVHAQFELGKSKIKLNVTPKKEVPKKVIPKTNSVVNKSEQIIKYEPEFFKPKSAINFVSTVPKVGEIEEKKYEVKSAQELFEIQNQQLESSVAVSLDSDVFLGEYIIYTTSIIFKYRDFGAIDGDNIRIWLNGVIVKDYSTLEIDYKVFECVLNEGSNVVQIEALNVGQYFPNTGGFVLLDGNNKVLSNQNWGLAEGYRAVFRIKRIKGLEEEKEKK
jgi:hypothetical protein